MIDVGRLEEFAEGSVTVRRVGPRGREVGIVRWTDGRVYALHNRCPHHGGPLCRGAVAASLQARDPGGPGQVAADVARPVVICPWHHWEFDATTGECIADPRIRSRTYRTHVDGGRVYVDLA